MCNSPDLILYLYNIEWQIEFYVKHAMTCSEYWYLGAMQKHHELYNPINIRA